MKRANQAAETRRTDRPITGELPEGANSVRPGNRPFRSGAPVEWQRRLRLRRPSGQRTKGHQPGTRLTLGAFRTTNQGALSLESRLRPAAAQQDNRLRRYALRLASLPKVDQAREMFEAMDGEGEIRATTPVLPRVLERERRNGPTGGGIPPGGYSRNRGRGRGGQGSKARPTRPHHLQGRIPS